MSVFQTQEWWSVQMSEDEEYDLGSMIVGNIDNSSGAMFANKIAVGSQQGMFRMYQPSRPQYRVEDLVLEMSLGAPILQLLLGNFMPRTNLLAVAVLHPRSLVVYQIVPQGVKDGRVSFHQMRKEYEHQLGINGEHFTAYNMTSGTLCGTKDSEMIIVQSMDGKVQVFDQQNDAFVRQLVDCLLPGPVTYVPKIDSFLTVTHACSAECYRYQILVNDIGSGGERGEKGSNGVATVRNTMNEWSFNLGESCRQILQGNFTQAAAASEDRNRQQGTAHAAELLMLCDGSLFLLKCESGSLVQQRRLENADGSCMCAFPSAQRSNVSNFVLATQGKMLQVYSNFTLVWAAKLMDMPVQLAVSDFGQQKGLIVTLTDNGLLTLNYLGTKPPVSAVMSQVRELDYEKIDLEHKALLQVIRESQYDTKSDTMGRIVIRSQLTKTLDADPYTASGDNDIKPPAGLVMMNSGLGLDHGGYDTNSSRGPFMKISIRLFLTFTGEHPVSNVQLIITPPTSIHAVPKNVVLQKVSGIRSTPMMVKLSLYALATSLPTTLDCCVAANYLTSKGEPRVSSHVIKVPLHLVCQPKPPVKSSGCKLIIDTPDHTAVPLTYLFDDVLYAAQQSGSDLADTLGANASQAMGFQMFAPIVSSSSLSNGQSSADMNTPASPSDGVVSIMVSKNAGRYRVQADSYPGLYLIFSELERRLRQKIYDDKEGEGTNDPKASKSPQEVKKQTVGLVKCSDQLPLEEFFALVGRHFNSRQEIAEYNNKLNDLAQQYRIVQKRLLVRFKDKNPTPLHGLEVLMKETYQELLDISDKIEFTQNRLRSEQVELNGFCRLFVKLCSLKYELPPAEEQYLTSLLCPDILEGSEQGWEESVDASLTFLLKTTMAASTKETTTSLSGMTMSIPTSIQTLKKHMLMLVDRLEKGARPTLPNPEPMTTSEKPGVVMTEAQVV